MSEPARARVSTPGERHARRAARAEAGPAVTLPRPAAPTSRMRRTLRAVSTLALVAGAILVADAVTTLLWQEPVTHLLAAREQAGLDRQLARLRAAPASPGERRALGTLHGTRERVAFLARTLDRTSAPGAALGELRLPRLHERVVFVKGTSPTSLRKGPGAYDGVGLPGLPGTAAIAGHRTTYGAPFRHIDRLHKGDAVVVAMPYATLTYRVERTRIVQPSDFGILARRSYDRLVLSACHPLYSAAERIVVLSRLVATVPAGTLVGV